MNDNYALALGWMVSICCEILLFFVVREKLKRQLFFDLWEMFTIVTVFQIPMFCTIFLTINQLRK